MNNLNENNNTTILSNEKSIVKIINEKIENSIQNEKSLSIYIIADYCFFEGFKQIYKNIDAIFQKKLLRDFKIIFSSKKKLTVKESLNELKKDAASLDIETYEFIKLLSDKKHFDIRVLTEKKIDLKFFIFKNEDDEVNVWTGSSNLSENNYKDEIELIMPVVITEENNEYYLKLFNDIWKMSNDKLNFIKPIEILKSASECDSFYLNQKDFISYMIKTIGKEYLVKNIGFDLSLISEFQNMSYYFCLEKLINYGGAFLFNTAGLSKIDIASMVSKYYKENDKKILIIYSSCELIKWKNSIQKIGLKEKDVEYLSREELYNNNFKYENYFGIDLVIVSEAHLFRNSKFKNNLRSSLEDILKINIDCSCLFISDFPFVSSLLDFTNMLKLIIKDVYFEKHKKEGVIRKINLFENNVKNNQISIEDVVLLNELIDIFSININQSDLTLYFKNANLCQEKMIISQVRYAYDHEIYMKLYDKLIPFLGELNFEYTKLWSKKVNENIILYYKWKIYKKLESSIYSFRLCLKKVLEKCIAVKKIVLNENIEIDNNLFRKEQVENIKNNFSSVERNIQDNILANINKDIKSIETMFSNIEQLRYLENRDDKITNVLKILRNENKPTIIYSESKDTVLYVERRLKEYGGFRICVYYSDELTLEEYDPVETPPLNKELIIESFKKGEMDIFITTDTFDENLVLQRAEVIINFDIPLNPSILVQRLNRIGRSSQKKYKIFNFQPDRRIYKETDMFEKLNFSVENIFSYMGLDFINWLTKEKKCESFQNNLQNILMYINEYNDLLSSVNPEQLQQKNYIESLNNNIILREFIKNLNISEDTIKLTDDNYKKPVYTNFKSEKEDHFAFFKYNDVVYYSSNLVFAETNLDNELKNTELKNITNSFKEIIFTENKNFQKQNELFDANEELSFNNLSIGIIKYIKEE